MKPGIGAGSAELSRTKVPTFENSGHAAGRRVPSFASVSLQAVLPSAALGLIEKPSGSDTVDAFSGEGDGVVASCGCGTVSFTSTPEALSVAVVVGLALRL